MEKPTIHAPEVVELEQQAADAGVDFKTALTRARVAQSTVWRWAAGKTDPDTKTLRRIKSAIAELRSEAA